MSRITKDWADALISQYSEEYRRNKPFPYIVIDNFYPNEDRLESLLRDFGISPGSWEKKIHQNSKKQICYKLLSDKTITYSIMQEMNSPIMLYLIEGLSGILNIKPDPLYMGGGLHETKKEGFLNVHVDFNWHKELKMHRRINLLLYLNKDWKEEYGGHLELWDGENMVHKILPIWNRCVIFNTSDISFHGHPHPLACPEDKSRKSLAMYYYTKNRPDNEKSDPHTTIYKGKKL